MALIVQKYGGTSVGNAERIKNVVIELIRRIPLDLDSPCHHALDHAKVGG